MAAAKHELVAVLSQWLGWNAADVETLDRSAGTDPDIAGLLDVQDPTTIEARSC